VGIIAATVQIDAGDDSQRHGPSQQWPQENQQQGDPQRHEEAALAASLVCQRVAMA
jgi:hypothetical protein